MFDVARAYKRGYKDGYSDALHRMERQRRREAEGYRILDSENVPKNL